MKIETTLETITPEIASEYLKANKSNREIKEELVKQYATEIKHGAWALNHQGIAFTDDGDLFDGQHRLLAIQLAGTSIEMLVTRGLPKAIECGGINIFTQDTVDSGSKRSVADQLFLRHGIKESRIWTRLVTAIAKIATNFSTKTTLNESKALFIGKLFGEEMEHRLGRRSDKSVLAAAYVLAPIILAGKVDRAKADVFHDGLNTGKNLNGDDPILLCRDTLLAAGGKGKHTVKTTWRSRLVFTALRAHFEGERRQQLKMAPNAVEYFQTKLQNDMRAIRARFTLPD